MNLSVHCCAEHKALIGFGGICSVLHFEESRTQESPESSSPLVRSPSIEMSQIDTEEFTDTCTRW